MTNEEYEQAKAKRFHDRTEMAAAKAGEYASKSDRLANFKDAAREFGVSPLLVAGIYWHKHVSAVKRYISEVNAGRDPQLSEPIEGRIQDCQEYLDIIAALVSEQATNLSDSEMYRDLNVLLQRRV